MVGDEGGLISRFHVDNQTTTFKSFRTIFQGLDHLPTFLSDTMMPNINPDSAAEALVLASGGYDACQNMVRDNLPSASLPSSNFVIY